MATATLPPQSLLSAEEAAEFLGVVVGTLSVWRCTRRVQIPYVKVGRSVKYRLSDLEAFVESRRVGEITEPAAV